MDSKNSTRHVRFIGISSMMFSTMVTTPKSCDTFVVLPANTKCGSLIFGKNSDRPQNEVQEVVLVKGGRRDTNLKCTYISIEESTAPVNTVILSKPAWIWGAEMGANEKNVVIGNEAVWTNYNEGDGDARQRRLLGMDLVRLGLERGNSATDALNVITTLLEKYGQGGPCSESDDSHFYHNSFLIADPTEAWVLETCGRLWAAEKVVKGYRNISNGLTISTKIDKHSEKLQETALNMGLWDGQNEFDFTKCFSSGGDEKRYEYGRKLLKERCAQGSFSVEDMFYILRHKESNICRDCDDTFPTQGSQVSRITADGISVHWFTATPDPSKSFFKPFIFTPNAKISPYTESETNKGKREHFLYEHHMKQVLKKNQTETNQMLRDLEEKYFRNVADLIERHKYGKSSPNELDTIMKDSVEAEVQLYTKI